MRFNSYYIAGCILILCACSNPNKKSAEIESPTVAPRSSVPAPSSEVPTGNAGASAPTPVPDKAVVVTTKPVLSKIEAKKDGVSCKKGGELRTLEVEAAKAKGCQLWYSKSGHRKSVASSDSGVTHCEQVRDKIRTNLKTAGYECLTAETLPAKAEASAAKSSVTAVVAPSPVASSSAAVNPSPTASPSAPSKK